MQSIAGTYDYLVCTAKSILQATKNFKNLTRGDRLELFLVMNHTELSTKTIIHVFKLIHRKLTFSYYLTSSNLKNIRKSIFKTRNRLRNPGMSNRLKLCYNATIFNKQRLRGFQNIAQHEFDPIDLSFTAMSPYFSQCPWVPF